MVEIALWPLENPKLFAVDGLTASAILETIQLCPETDKYIKAIPFVPIYYQYQIKYYLSGYFTLGCSQQFFMPYPKWALDAMLNKQMQNNFTILSRLIHSKSYRNEQNTSRKKPCLGLEKRYDFGDRFIKTSLELNKQELTILDNLLTLFPYPGRNRWLVTKFLNIKLEDFPRELLILAANAYDSFGNTILGVAAEYGVPVVVKKLLEMGADLHICDQYLKFPIFWAINNRFSFRERGSIKAAAIVQCFLDNGARIDLRYRGLTPLDYALSKGFFAAAYLIENHKRQLSLKNFAAKSSFGLFQLPLEAKNQIFSFLTQADMAAMMKLNRVSEEKDPECLNQASYHF